MNWIITINGLVIENTDDLRTQITPLLLDENNLEVIIPDIIKATEGTGPNSDLEHWQDSEPGVMAILEFRNAPHALVATPAVISDMQLPLDAAIATTAATGLLAGLDDHFLMDAETGFLSINKDDVPPMELAGEMFQRVMHINDAARKLEEFGKWQTGSLYDSCEDVYGEAFSVTQYVEMQEQAYNTIITAVATFRCFKDKRYNLSFTHHKEAYYSKLPDCEQRKMMHYLLGVSEYFSLPCKEQRKLFTYARTFGIEVLDANIDVAWEYEEDAATLIKAENPDAILTREDLIDRITIKEANRNFLFTLGDTQYHTRSLEDLLPRGATNIICTDNWRAIRPGGQEREIPRWERPTEMHEASEASND